MRRVSLLLFLTAFTVFAAEDSPSGTRITPPTLREISPLGLPRGGTVELSITGYNLAHASAIYFSEPGITARITRIKELPDQDDVRLGGNGTPLTVDLGPLPVRNELTAELDIPGTAPIGPVNFRVLTPLGLSPQGAISIEPYYGEAPDREPNDSPDEVTDVTVLPAILVGTISKPGDIDYYRINVRAGEQIVFENNGRMLGSMLSPVIKIYDENANLLHEFTEEGERGLNSFAHTFEKAGVYLIRISDYEDGGSPRHFYRIMAGRLPVVLTAFPLGIEQGKTAEISLTGFNLAQPKTTVKGQPNEGEYDSVWIRPTAAVGPSFTKLRLAIGKDPEIFAKSTTAAQAVTLPVTVNGRLTDAHHDFRFHARKGEKLIFEVNASRLGSPLDSQLDVLTGKGEPIERATIRATLQTSLVLRDHDSVGSGIRLDSQTGFQVGDYVMIGTEVDRIEAMPRGPDDDFVMANFGGTRLAYLDTSTEAHALDTPAYKVEFHPPAAKFAPNGLPLIHLRFHNDDGGPGFGKDSRLHFTAPADGDYIVRLGDVRGLTGPEYTYRLTIRPPRPDFELSVSPENPNVPAGGRIPIVVSALRLDDFDGPIPISVKDLPPGMHATSGAIAPGQKSATLVLSADPNAAVAQAFPLKVVDEKGREADSTDRLKLLALMPRADVDLKAESRELTLEPGGRATIAVSVSRNNGFAGRVPLNVRNLPPSVRVTDVGLNGVLVNENETRRTFTLEALPGAEPLEQPIYISGDIETRAGMQQNSFVTEPVTLHIRTAAPGNHQSTAKMTASLNDGIPGR